MNKNYAREIIDGIISRRIAAGFDEPLTHFQKTMTGARYSALISWDNWRINDEGTYSGWLEDVLMELGIVQGNGEWYESAWRHDSYISEALKNQWQEFVENELDTLDDYSEFWEG